MRKEHLRPWCLQQLLVWEEKCFRYRSRLAKLIANKKGEHYAKTMSWIRSKISIALLRSALICRRESRAKGRAPYQDIENAAIEIEHVEGAIMDYE